jgi:opacity protein-like surface antigen
MTTNRGSYLLGAVLGSAVVLASASAVMAADIYQGNDLKGGYDVAPVESSRAIYFKGYVGQANPEVGGMSNEIYDATGIFSVRDHDIKSSPLYGVGVGWQLRHWLRLDGTIEYRGDATFFGSDISTFPGTNEYTADVKSWLGLANAYWDIFNYCGFTPYIGAGIGFATISVQGLRDDGVVDDPVFGAVPSIAYGADKTTTNFAYAFYAGASFDVTPQVTLDLSYRWANLGDARSGPVTTFDSTIPAYSGQRLDNITSNDVLLAVRYKWQRDEPVYAIK